MLRGNYLATADEKGRVKIPADFLAELRRSGKRYYVTSATGDHARIYPMKVWEEIEKKVWPRSRPTTRRGKSFFHERTITDKSSKWMGRGAF